MPVLEGQEKRVDVPLLRESRIDTRHQSESRDSLLPHTVLGWIPFWWSRVLFPGRADGRPAQSWHFWAMLILPGLLLYPCMSFYLFEPDEGRYAQIPHEMLVRGEWIVPTLQGQPYLDKPPLFYWCVMLSYLVFGYHDWAARLIPALATHGTILLAYFLGRRMIGARPAFWGALLLTFAPGFIGISRLLLLDGLLTFLVTLSVFSAYLSVSAPRLRHGWWYVSALACGLGILTKGPIALILTIPPIWLVRRLEGQSNSLPWKHVFGYLALAFMVNVPWYVAIILREPEFARYFFWQHNIQRFAEPFDHQRPIWFFVPLLLIGLLPATFGLIAAVRFLLSSEDGDVQARPRSLGFLLLSGLWCFAFFSFSGCKLPTYILPAFVPLSLALGVYFHRRFDDAPPRWLLAGLGIWAGLIFIGHWMVVPAVAEIRSPMGEPERVREWCDAQTPVYCFPRPVDSVAFYLGRCDFESHRSKHLDQLLLELERHPHAVVLFGHRHSIDLLRMHLPKHLVMTEEAPLGLCKMAKIERRPDQRAERQPTE